MTVYAAEAPFCYRYHWDDYILIGKFYACFKGLVSTLE